MTINGMVRKRRKRRRRRRRRYEMKRGGGGRQKKIRLKEEKVRKNKTETSFMICIINL